MVKSSARSFARFWLGAIVALLAMVAGEVGAWAKDAPRATVVVIVEGGAGEKLRAAIVAALPAPWGAADAGAVAAAAKKHKLPATVGDAKGRARYVEKLAEITPEVGANAAVLVHIAKGQRDSAHVVLLTQTGAALVDRDISLAEPNEDAAFITRGFSRELAALVPAEPTKAAPAPAPAVATPAPAPAAGAKPAPAAPPPPPVEAPKPKPAEATVTTPAAPADSSSDLPPWLLASLTFELANRSLDFRQVVTPNVRGDDSGIVVMPSIGGDLFPLAATSVPVMRDIGLFGDFKLGLGSDKTLTDGTKAPFTWQRFDAGLKYRIWLKERSWKAPMIALAMSYGEDAYIYHPETTPKEPLDAPSAAYKVLRPRAEGRIPIGPIVVNLGAGYLGVLKKVKFVGLFRDPSVYAWEIDLGIGVPITKVLEVRGGIAYRRFVHQFSPAQGDGYIANVAVDQILRGDLGASVHF